MRLPAIAILLLLLIGTESLRSQSSPQETQDRLHVPCATDLMQEALFTHQPALRHEAERFNSLLHAMLDRSQGDKKSSRMPQGAAIYTIPVVVHLVHDGGAENIADDQVRAGIEMLNEAFANTGVFDSTTGVPVEIRFCLARQTEDGKVTSGITRTQSSLTITLMEDDRNLKNLIRWNPHNYLNIWLVRDVRSRSFGDAVAGYAFLPQSHGKPHDGIVGEAAPFGSSPDRMKLFIHEVGHYLGLSHTFQGGCSNNNCLMQGDYVCDTPPDASTAPADCNVPVNSCGSDTNDRSVNNPFRPVAEGGLGDQSDMTGNYMDYSRIDCQSAFTEGQRERMVAALITSRRSLILSNGCEDPCTADVTAAFTASSVSIDVGEEIIFTNISTGASTYEWWVGGMKVAGSRDYRHRFMQKGEYRVLLVVGNGDSTCQRSFWLTVHVNCPLQPRITAGSTSIQPGESLTFHNTSPDSVSYEWFLDGKSLGKNLLNVRQKFDQPGGYQVYLVASNGICSDTAIVYVRVGNCGESKVWDKWYFGRNTGLDFTGGTLRILNDGALSAREGVATISDKSGRLLFYTDGSTVWDGTHAVMAGGTGLAGSIYSSQACIIVPAPLDTAIYYIFTTSNWTDAEHLLSYSVVDMSRNGGRGAVMVKNIVLNDNVSERVAAVYHANCMDVWVVSHEMNNNRWVAYLVTSDGVGTEPVVSNIGSIAVGDFPDGHRYGGIRFSPNGKLLCSTLGGSEASTTVELFDFNPAIGRVLQPRLLADEGFIPGAVSSEFSPDGKLLYVGSTNGTYIIQYRLDVGSTELMRASALNVASGDDIKSSLQLGPDGRIYVTKPERRYLDVIQLPNNPGTACVYQWSVIDLQGRGATMGLPSRISGYNMKELAIQGPPMVCTDQPVLYHAYGGWCASGSYHWRVEGPAEVLSANGGKLLLRFDGSGPAWLIAESRGLCGPFYDTLAVGIATAPPLNLGEDTSLCLGNSLTLDAGTGFTGYRWDDGSTARMLTVIRSGVYHVQATSAGGCILHDTIRVTFASPGGTLDLGSDTTMCGGGVVVLDAGEGFAHYRWSDGSDGRMLTAFAPGTYWVTATPHCGALRTDSITIAPGVAAAIDLGPDRAICDGMETILGVPVPGMDYLWSTGDTMPTITVKTSGTYWVRVSTGECIAYDTIVVTVTTPTDRLVDLGPDRSFCEGGSLVLGDEKPGLRYLWSRGDTTPTITVDAPGIYWVRAFNDECESYDTIAVATATLSEKLVELGPPRFLCDGSSVVLGEAKPGHTYLWSTGETTPTITVAAAGSYWLSVFDGSCRSEDTVDISVTDGEVYLVDLPDLSGGAPLPPGTDITLPVRLLTTRGEPYRPGLSYSGRIRYRRTLLHPIDATSEGIIDGEDRVISFNGTISDSDTLLMLRFRVMLGDSAVALVMVDTFSIAGECVREIAMARGVVLVSVCRASDQDRLITAGGAFALRVPQPNPAGSRTTVHYALMEEGIVALRIIDPLGGVVRTIAEGPMEPGEYVATFDVGSLPAGSYFITLASPTGVLSEKFMVKR